jgi:nucleoside-diphosphate-sugar epimerase
VAHHAKLVFFDNIYMIDPAHLSNVTEEAPIKPATGKGKVRAQVNEIIWQAVNNYGLTAMIVRGADFIAPVNTAFAATILQKLKLGKPAGWLINADVPHNFTYAADAGRAMAWLGTTTNTWNQVWNAPTTETMTGRQWVQRAAQVMGATPKLQVMPAWLLNVLGLFIPALREVAELSYQWQNPYTVCSDKFFGRFPNFKPTPLDEAIAETVKQMP